MPKFVAIMSGILIMLSVGHMLFSARRSEIEIGVMVIIAMLVAFPILLMAFSSLRRVWLVRLGTGIGWNKVRRVLHRAGPRHLEQSQLVWALPAVACNCFLLVFRPFPIGWSPSGFWHWDDMEVL